MSGGGAGVNSPGGMSSPHQNRLEQVMEDGSFNINTIGFPGRDFVLVQTDRFGGMKSALGKEYDDKIKVVDRSNQKWYLVTIDDK